MTDEAMSPLRRRMIEDMAIRKLAPKTQSRLTKKAGGCRKSQIHLGSTTLMMIRNPERQVLPRTSVLSARKPASW